jgi:Pro-kumamolisin, activation domain/Bacterial Ig-like domain (group 3)
VNPTTNQYLYVQQPYVQRTSRRVAILSGKQSKLLGASLRHAAFALLAILLVLALPILAGAQSSAVRPRITSRVNDGVLTPLRGNVHPLARAQYDQGAVADSQPMRRMLLLLQRSPDQEAALKQLMDQQQSSASPNYRKWVTPQGFGQQFGPADADVQAVTDWLTSHGFQVAKVSAGKTLIEFSGTAGQVRNAFHTEIHRYLVNGQMHYANNGDPQIPTALAAVVAGPVSLHNFPKKAQSRTVGTFRETKATGQIAPLFTFNSINCGTASCNAVGPGDFATIYGVEKLWNPGINGTKIDGNGQTIAIVGDSEICTASSPDFSIPVNQGGCSSTDDVASFRSQFGLPANAPNVILDGPDPGFNGDETEGDLDVEWSGAVAKNATIDFVIAEDTEATFGTDLAAEYVVDNNLASVLSESFGECEAGLGTSGNFFEAVLWEQAAAQGITVIVSAGDSGSAGCDDPNSETAAGQNPNLAFGPAVNGIASTPFNVAAGGTDFDTTATAYQATYWSAANTADTNGVKDISATTYIPETTWNDSCAQNATTLTGCTPGNGGIVAGGGGQSNCASQDNLNNCYYYPKPTWQTLASGSGLTLANDLARDIPDISLFAADGFKSNSFYIICESDLDPGGAACNLGTPYFDFVGVGGTSSAAPTFAGIMALVNENMAINHPALSARQGNANYVLYKLAAAQTTAATNCNSSSTTVSSTCTFYDITKGNNSVPCVGATFGCSSTTGAFGIMETDNVNPPFNLTGNIAWNTAAGLDLATGLGSVNAFNLVFNWTNPTFQATTTTLCLSLVQTASASCAAPPSFPHGTVVYVNAEVDHIGIPIQVTETFPPSPPPTGTFVDPNTPSVAEDVALIGTFSGGNTGGVDLFTSNSYAINNADIYPLASGTTVGQNFNTTFLTGGTYNVAAHFAGDGTYGGSYSSPITVTVTPEGSAATVSVLSFDPVGNQIASPIPYGDFSLVRVDVVGATSGQENANGIVTLKDNGGLIAGPTGTLTSQFNLNTEGYLEDQTAFFSVGAHSFVATFGGDPSYNASAASAAATMTVAQAATATTVAPSPLTASPGQNVTLTATVSTLSQGNPPTGTVQFLVGGVATGVPVAVIGSLNANTGFVQAIATLHTTALPTGSDAITAQYSSDANYAAGAVSTAVTVSVGSAGINLTPATGTVTLTVSSPGSTSTTQLITATGTPGFAGTVTLSAAVTATPSGAVDSPTCSFGAPDSNFTAPSTITLSAASETGTATMSCASTAASEIVFRPTTRPSGRAWSLVGVAISLVCLFILLTVPKDRRWRFAPLAILFLVVAAAGVSCGGSSTSGGGGGVTNPGTTLGNYTVTVTATPSTGTAQVITITVNVQ